MVFNNFVVFETNKEEKTSTSHLIRRDTIITDSIGLFSQGIGQTD